MAELRQWQMGPDKPHTDVDQQCQLSDKLDTDAQQRQARAVRVRVVGVWAPNQPEPWWLATVLPNPLADIVANGVTMHCKVCPCSQKRRVQS